MDTGVSAVNSRGHVISVNNIRSPTISPHITKLCHVHHHNLAIVICQIWGCTDARLLLRLLH